MNGLTIEEILTLIRLHMGIMQDDSYHYREAGVDGDSFQVQWDRVDTLIQALKVLDRIGVPNNG